ncbi:antiviral reverse transcriptase Drt3b [Spirochaeta africana]|uniref:Reverse transcriptase (RNA-dependent DNA polymerase) n=1 Tax=Spirochaeta africana (strain ATCC 700263 / DSM 8902 / Z-7692) TaxID=889378 RepID=H9UHW0_SPIAZ|nr:antiviral reverse transcriptase Drt3b [Spirochaeta africana]AFG37103.1 Reverse transcriptase (RNA-dependent DNA polymerase) [Spirochaeta africana DSM 8902]
MSIKQVRFPYKKERCLLSDVLPFEIPISFSNRHFYSFVLRHRISFEDNAIVWLKVDKALDKIVMLLFAMPDNANRITTVQRYVGEKLTDFVRYQIDDKGISKSNRQPKPERFMIPFCYKVRHKETEFRELCIPHPKSQLLVVDFYDRCKETILYYTSLSSFTIRAPSRISRVRYHQDKLHFERLSTESEIVEQSDQEYESLKSFFVYKDYSNIYKFYESYRYHRAEKKYNKLLKLDISKCFDSIYSHSIGWAVIGKDAQKASLDLNGGTFPDRFDKLMHHMNNGETHGIIIGPEFSRIFAEVILQAIDRDVSHKLAAKNEALLHGRDYEIFRYVDDYFIFVNDESDATQIVDDLQHTLKKYKLYLNTAKAITYEKPIITEITMAKQQIARLLEERIKFSLEDVEVDSGEVQTKGSVHVNANALITSFKTIIKTCGVEYKDMLNYSLAIVERRCEKIFTNYLKVSPELRSQTKLINAIKGIIEFLFFIYSVSPRVNTTIRLCRILRVVILFLKTGHVEQEQVQSVHKQIFDNVCFVLKKNETSEQTQVETLYLLIALSELGRDYWLEESVLSTYLGIKAIDTGINSEPIKSLNYFSISVSLFYMKNKVRYNTLRNRIIDTALERIRMRSETCHKNAEMIFLLFDLISCPYVPYDRKRKVLELFKVTDPSLVDEIITFTDSNNRSQQWFTNWYDFDFGKELDAKRSQEVY